MVLTVDVPADLIHGDVDEGYGGVADAFRRNFVESGEVGAACAVHRDGRCVVDLWGGYRDGRARLPWERDTVVPVFSSTKGLSSMAVAVAHSRGWLALDEPVASYWPEFAQGGKEAITVRQLLAHQAGLAALDRPLDLDTAGDIDRLAAVLAVQRPSWTPGTRHGYHAMTLGFYESVLLHRVDPRHRSVGRLFADEIAAPLGIDFWIGLPPAVAASRVATIHAFAPPEMLLHLGKMPTRLLLSMLNPRGVLSRAMRTVPELMKPDAFNRREVLAVELPSVNGTGEVRAMAAAYGALATGGRALRLRPETVRALEDPATEPSGGRRDVVLHMDTVFSLGYLKPYTDFRFGSSPRAYGTPGGGGSLAFADPDAALGYGYAMNRLGFHMPVDPREFRVRQALYDVIGGPPQHPRPKGA